MTALDISIMAFAVFCGGFSVGWVVASVMAYGDASDGK